MERRVAIIGAGMSGLLACKYILEKGFHPIVFEAEDGIGGLWRHTIESTKLQSNKQSWKFSDFQWDSSVKEEYPSNPQVLHYLNSYAQHFEIIPYIKFNSKVINLDYVGESSEEMMSWELWGGNGRPFGSKGTWHVAVQDTKNFSIERWGISKLVESCLKWRLPMKKHGLVPSQSFLQDHSGCETAMLPDNYYDKIEEGSIVIKKSNSFGFYREGLIIDGETKPIETDIVIFATGYKGDQKLTSIFKSPIFQKYIQGPPTSTIPLYRQIIHPRIPQLAVIGYAEALSNLYANEIRCQWLAHFLDGNFEVPSIRKMEEDVKVWEDYLKQYGGRHHWKACIITWGIWYNDQLCKDMGRNHRRKKGLFAELFEPYGPSDYVGLIHK